MYRKGCEIVGVKRMVQADRRIVKQNKLNLFFRSIVLACAILSIFITAGIILSLLFNTFSFFREVSLFEFLTGKQWTPLFANPSSSGRLS